MGKAWRWPRPSCSFRFRALLRLNLKQLRAESSPSTGAPAGGWTIGRAIGERGTSTGGDHPHGLPQRFGIALGSMWRATP